MKTGRSIQETCREIERQAAAKVDYQVNTSCILMESYEGTPMLRVLDEQGEDLVEPMDIRQTAHEQIGTYLNIPRKYYDRMQTEDPDLLACNVNSWFRKSPEQRMIRTMDGHARAFLSNRYRRIDNLDVARATLPIIAEMPEARYESCEITDDYLFLKVVNPRLTAEVVPGDIVQAGVVISNSETGRGAVCVQPLVYRLICSNGMTVNEARTRRNHVGRINLSEENFSIYRDETLAVDDQAFIMKLQDTVRAAVEEAKFAFVVDKMREAAGIKLNTAKIPDIVKMTGSSLGYTDSEGESIMKYLIEGGDLSLYGLANAVTRYSQDVESYDRASKLEEIGYNVLTMPADLYRSISHVDSLVA